jgi:hypothetical protein
MKNYTKKILNRWLNGKTPRFRKSVDAKQSEPQNSEKIGHDQPTEFNYANISNNFFVV